MNAGKPLSSSAQSVVSVARRLPQMIQMNRLGQVALVAMGLLISSGTAQTQTPSAPPSQDAATATG
jgi:hypothetical protein